MEHTLNAEIADRVREAMAECDMSIVTLVEKSGIAERTLKRRLKGDSDWNTGELARVAKATATPEVPVGIRLDRLMGATRAP